MSIQITPELLTAAAGLVAAIGGLIKNARDNRRNRKQVERVARAAAQGPKVVAELVDDAEKTGEFTRPTLGSDRDPKG